MINIVVIVYHRQLQRKEGFITSVLGPEPHQRVAEKLHPGLVFCGRMDPRSEVRKIPSIRWARLGLIAFLKAHYL